MQCVCALFALCVYFLAFMCAMGARRSVREGCVFEMPFGRCNS